MQRLSGEQRSEGRVPPRRGSLVERVAEQLGDEMNSPATDVVTVPLMEDPAVEEGLFDDRADFHRMIREVGELCHARRVLFFTDATQAVGHVPVDVEADHVDLLCLSAHKLYGPKGVGALYVRRQAPRVRLVPQTLGGGHERGLRSGTLNVPGIVGLGAACELRREELAADARREAELRDRLEARLTSALDEVCAPLVHLARARKRFPVETINGEPADASPYLPALSRVLTPVRDHRQTLFEAR